ncbi:FxsA family protein [Streptosporangium sp. NPDC051022]|uniref:FxsA family protein n=1 Tax=Streptosporangium sp. NPDC051022 TaxID=3155752 RepID=UPI003433F065
MRSLLFLIFLAVPVLEIWVLFQVGQVIGGWPTVLLLLAGALVGAWIVRREGRRIWRSLQTALDSGRMPDRELADGAMILAGGTLLLVPGFVTDVLALLCLLPFTRPLVRRAGTWLFARRIRTLAERTAGPGLGSPFGAPGAPGSPFDPFEAMRGQGRGPGSVIHGEVIRDEPERPGTRDSSRDLTGH